MAELKVTINYGDVKEHIDKRIQELKKEFVTRAAVDRMVEEIKSVKAVTNEEIIEHDRKDLIEFVNGINQCLMIIDKYTNAESEPQKSEGKDGHVD